VSRRGVRKADKGRKEGGKADKGRKGGGEGRQTVAHNLHGVEEEGADTPKSTTSSCASRNRRTPDTKSSMTPFVRLEEDVLGGRMCQQAKCEDEIKVNFHVNFREEICLSPQQAGSACYTCTLLLLLLCYFHTLP
jgi:hypothetical protein